MSNLLVITAIILATIMVLVVITTELADSAIKLVIIATAIVQVLPF